MKRFFFLGAILFPSLAMGEVWDGEARLRTQDGSSICDVSVDVQLTDEAFTLGKRTLQCGDETFEYDAISFERDSQDRLAALKFVFNFATQTGLLGALSWWDLPRRPVQSS
jgi:hypothetical protein